MDHSKIASIHSVQMQSAYVLGAKPFRETSLLLEVFCRDYGRVSLVARGARRTWRNSKTGLGKSRPRFDGLLQPFVPLVLSWSGRGDLFNLTHAEQNGTSPALAGRLLLGGWYMNELLVRTLGHWDDHVQLFVDYQLALHSLATSLPISLRQFEKSLLTVLGVLPSLDREGVTGLAVQPQLRYVFCPLNGLTQTHSDEVNSLSCFQGDFLLAVQSGDWQQLDRIANVKRLFRLMLDHVLAGQPIRSRDLL